MVTACSLEVVASRLAASQVRVMMALNEALPVFSRLYR